jgi:peptidyl-dipeptidase Dcp
LSTQTIYAQTQSVKMAKSSFTKELPYGIKAPPFNLFKDGHYKPAFEYAKIHDQS